MDQDHQFLRFVEYSNRCVTLVLVTIILMAVTLSVLPFLTERCKRPIKRSKMFPIKNLQKSRLCGRLPIRFLSLKRPKVT